MNKYIGLVAAIILVALTPIRAKAITEIKSDSNNKFGIHIINETDLTDAKNLINSNGGDWGYVTFVITETDRNHDRWQSVFDQMRRDHLIPIVRLASKPRGDVWEIPQEAEINNWVAFLNGLNWVTQNRFVIINNEPNHAKEWGGKIDPAGYASYLKKISTSLKQASEDFYILQAGLDPAAPNAAGTMNEFKFIKGMLSFDNKVFDYIDGWASHPYPDAPPQIYEDELKAIGKQLPVFITEAGWPLDKYTEQEAMDKILNAYKNIWSSSKVVAVTPFILNYSAPPFDRFSWKKPDGTFRSFYAEVKNLPKVKGTPKQFESGQIYAAFIQPIIVPGINFFGVIVAKNNGQSIWDQKAVTIGSELNDFHLNWATLNSVEPGKIGVIFFTSKVFQEGKIYTNSVYLKSLGGTRITNSFSVESVLLTLDRREIGSFIFKLLRSLGFTIFSQ